MELGSWYVGTLANTSRREVSFIMLWSSVIAWRVGFYMEGVFAHVQSGHILHGHIISIPQHKVFALFTLCASRRRSNYQLYSLCVDPTGTRTHDLQHSKRAC
jgi:hypothetical protein